MLHLPKKRIAIYADRHSKASPSPIDRELRRSFPQPSVAIEMVDQQDLRKDGFFGSDLMLFVIPGIEGETSFYPDHIGPIGHRVRNYVAEGGSIFAQCGGASFVPLKTLFTPEWAGHKQRTEGLLGLFNGVAHGPIPGLGVNGEDPAYYRGLTAANVLIGGGDHQIVFPMVYTSGPTFIPNPGQAMTVHARYADAAGQPPAIVSFRYGHGFVLLSGPVPQNGYYPLSNLAHLASYDALMERVRPFEETRKWYFDHLMNHIRHHTLQHMLKTGFPAFQSI